MTVMAAIANGNPSRSRRSRRKIKGDLWPRPGQTNRPDRKKNIAMKKLSVASTTMSKPIHDLGSV
jgi:hypothetical protein